MQISSSTFYDTRNSVSIRLNDKEVMVIDEDPTSKRASEGKKARSQKAQELKKEQEAKKSSDPKELSQDEKRLVKDLSSRDSEVKTHEAAHQAAGGGMAGAASYTYQQGPDGKMYAIGGEVSISTPVSSSPQEALKNARTVAASALAAGSPSPQDFSVASSAKVMEMKALQEISKKAQEEIEGKESYKDSSSAQNSPSEEEVASLNISA